MDKSRLKEWKIDPLMEELQIRKCKVILYFELIFVYDVGQVFNLIFLHVDIQLFQYFFFFFFVILPFLGPLLCPLEGPRLGVESEL